MSRLLNIGKVSHIFTNLFVHAIHYSFLSWQAICTQKHPVHYTHMRPITPALLTNSSGIFLSEPWAEFRFDCHSQLRMALLEYKRDFSAQELVGSSYTDEPLPVSSLSTVLSLWWFVKYIIVYECIHHYVWHIKTRSLLYCTLTMETHSTIYADNSQEVVEFKMAYFFINCWNLFSHFRAANKTWNTDVIRAGQLFSK